MALCHPPPARTPTKWMNMWRWLQHNNNIGAIKINVVLCFQRNVFFLLYAFFSFSQFQNKKATTTTRENAFFHFALLFEMLYVLEKKKKDIVEAYTRVPPLSSFFFLFMSASFPIFIMYLLLLLCVVPSLYKTHETSVRIKSNPWDVLLLLMLLLPLLKMMMMTMLLMLWHCLFRLFVSILFAAGLQVMPLLYFTLLCLCHAYHTHTENVLTKLSIINFKLFGFSIRNFASEFPITQST